MPFVRKSDAQSYKPPTDVKKLFVGRRDELHFFVENILKPDEPSHNILSLWGQGGVGKTTLVNRYVEEAMTAVGKALELGLPPLLLAPLRWLEEDREKFYEGYVRGLLESYGV